MDRTVTARKRHPRGVKRWTRDVVLLVALASVAGCGTPRQTLKPVPANPAVAQTVNMLVATTRAADPKPGVVFSGERGTGLSLADITVSIPDNRTVGQVNWPRTVPGDPARDFVATKVTPLPNAKIGSWFAALPNRPRPVLIFVHGFNTRFDASVFRFAQIVHDSDEKAAPVLFSWPSRGRIFDYGYDRESANFSRSDLAFVIRAAAQSPAVSSVTIMAHSLGAWLAVEAVRQIALQDHGVPSKVKNVILASPDLDIDVFRRQLEDMGPRRPRMTIFVSSNDRALSVSRLLGGGVTRVGAVDLTQEPYKSQFEHATGVTVIDLSHLNTGDRLQHTQFATSPEIVQLLGQREVAARLISNQRAQPEGLGGRAQDAGTLLGSLAGVVFSAPVLIFDSARGN